MRIKFRSITLTISERAKKGKNSQALEVLPAFSIEHRKMGGNVGRGGKGANREERVVVEGEEDSPRKLFKCKRLVAKFLFVRSAVHTHWQHEGYRYSEALYRVETVPCPPPLYPPLFHPFLSLSLSSSYVLSSSPPPILVTHQYQTILSYFSLEKEFIIVHRAG